MCRVVWMGVVSYNMIQEYDGGGSWLLCACFFVFFLLAGFSFVLFLDCVRSWNCKVGRNGEIAEGKVGNNMVVFML